MPQFRFQSHQRIRSGKDFERIYAARTTARGYLTRTLRADKGTRLRLYDPATKRASPALIIR